MYRGGSAFSYQPSISDSITSTGPVGENVANQRSTAWRDTRMFLFFFFINRVENLTGLAEASLESEEGKKWIKRHYTTARVGRNRKVESGSRQRYTLSPPLFLSRGSQFSLQPSGHGSIAEGKTSRRWTRVGRNSKKEGEIRERKREWEEGRERACKRQRWNMATCVSKNHNFYLWAGIGVQAG